LARNRYVDSPYASVSTSLWRIAAKLIASSELLRSAIVEPTAAGAELNLFNIWAVGSRPIGYERFSQSLQLISLSLASLRDPP
jgi:hypothetical protein